jgi:hypothetical protein
MGLPSPERDDAADRVVRRDSYGHAIAGNNFDSKAAHAAAQLRQHLMAGVALDAIKTPAVHCDHGSLHVYQVVFAQNRLEILSY